MRTGLRCGLLGWLFALLLLALVHPLLWGHPGMWWPLIRIAPLLLVGVGILGFLWGRTWNRIGK